MAMSENPKVDLSTPPAAILNQNISTTQGLTGVPAGTRINYESSNPKVLVDQLLQVFLTNCR